MSRSPSQLIITTYKSRTGYDQLWAKFVGNEDSPKRLQEEAFEAIPNVVWDDYGEDRGLSDLHLIVATSVLKI